MLWIGYEPVSSLQCRRLDVLDDTRGLGVAWRGVNPPAAAPALRLHWSSVLDISALPSVHIIANFIFTYNSQLPHLNTTALFYGDFLHINLTPSYTTPTNHGRPPNPHLPLRMHLPPPRDNNNPPLPPPPRYLPRPCDHPPPPLRRSPPVRHNPPHNAPLHDAGPPHHDHPPRRRLREAHPMAVRTLPRCGGV